MILEEGHRLVLVTKTDIQADRAAGKSKKNV